MTRIGSLCSGYGGLDQAAEQVTGGNVAWFCEYDDAPSKLLAHYFPAVPNYGDLKALEWSDDPVDVLTAGYPCQPFSGAGKRLGTDDPRHLFPWIARGVERMRPALLLLENVRGHLNLGFDVVLAELDRIGYDVRWTLLRAADVGAPHGRARLWIAARAREAGGWPRPAGDPTAYGEADGWASPEGGLFGHVPAAFPGTAGTMVQGHRWDLHVKAARPAPSPTEQGRTGPRLSPAFVLLPTPAVNDMGAGKTVEAWDAWTEAQKTKHGNGNGHGPSLHIEAARLAQRQEVDGGDTSDAAAGQGLPRLRCDVQPDALQGRSGEQQAVPGADDMLTVVREQQGRRDEGRAPLARASAPEAGVRALLHDDGAARPPHRPATGEQRPEEPADAMRVVSPAPSLAGGQGCTCGRSCGWGPYAAAIHRWERTLGVVAPPATEPGRTGPRLSPRFVEFMQGLPAGWVTDVPGVTRNHALKMLGNGVVPQCAAAAFALLGVSPELVRRERAA